MYFLVWTKCQSLKYAPSFLPSLCRKDALSKVTLERLSVTVSFSLEEKCSGGGQEEDVKRVRKYQSVANLLEIGIKFDILFGPE